jgi:thymidylate kinase
LNRAPFVVFIVLEGFSGTGKTSVAIALERKGWLRLPESAHSVPSTVPLADRADTSADYSLLGATMVHCSVISKLRTEMRIVSEGYLLSDLAYAKIRYDLKKSDAYPSMLAICKEILHKGLGPDLYVQLEAEADTIEARQRLKNDRDKNLTEFFRTRYYSALSEVHEELGENNVEKTHSDSNIEATLERILEILSRRELLDT